MLAIIKAAREYLRLDKANDGHLAAIEKNESTKEAILKQWGDALTATIHEIREKEARKTAEGA